MPGEFNFSVYRGDTVRFVFVLWNDEHNTIPIDLSGVVAKAQIRNVPGGNLITNLDLTIQVPNTIYATLTSENSSFLTTTGGFWDLQLTYPGGDVITILAGSIDVTMDVTDSQNNLALLSAPATGRSLAITRFKQRA
jgi:hypothetical protein